MNQPTILQHLKRLGHDSFVLEGPSVIYIDPWKLGGDLPRADLVLVTHDHFDHCSPEDVARISKAETVVIANPAAAKKLAGARVMQPGESLTVGDVQVTAVPAYNTNKFRSPGQPFHPKDALGNGYVIEVGGETLYHAGDTDHIPEMSQLDVTVALLPVSGTYVMTAAEAGEAARDIRAEVFVPMHYGDIVGGDADVVLFRSLCEQAGLRVAVV